MEDVVLGAVTCPSGELVLMDGGYLGLWSGNRSPDDTRQPDGIAAVDFEVVGRDAVAAAESFDRQSGQTLYDIPQDKVPQFTACFDGHCRERGLEAALRPFGRQVSHRDRVRRAVAAGDPDFLISGVPVVPVGNVPSTRPLPVTAARGQWGWRQIRIGLGDQAAAESRQLGSIGVDYARFVFADADSLADWVHDDPIDGLADVVFWGKDEAAIAEEFGASRTGTPGDDHYGWLNLPVGQASERALALNERRNAEPRRMFAFDVRPHSHHWKVMTDVRAAEHEAATITIAGADIMMALTSVGDGFFPVHLDLDASGVPTAVRITIEKDS
ncbi:hypothetical protein [Rugosimonospora africana]|uniref:hypothetical protein n=1 Tax=Rugosimonospora africana TaxID=556532 RepID=UPI001EF1C2E3|nr:hypothetical protein [Rugosimonospora africana]